MNKPSFLFFLFFLIFNSATSFSQEKSASKSSLFFEADYFKGQNKPHRPEIQNLVYKCAGVDLKLGWQSNGAKTWQQAYRHPSYGIGLNYNSFETPILGSPVSIYFFTDFPMVRFRKFKLSASYNLGASYGINPYDSIENPNNKATGTSGNAYFALMAHEELFITNRWALTAVQGFTHYSNGTLGYPNLGLNAPVYKVGLRYYTEAPQKFNKKKIKIEEHPWGINLRVMTGAKKLNANNVWYKELALNPLITKQLSYKNRVGIGFEAAINQARRDRRGQEDATLKEIISYAVNAEHEFRIERFTVFTQFGIYVYQQPTDKFYYERLGLTYALTPKIHTGIGLKAHYFKAEYVEVALNYSF